jgi:hypothetical protein
MEIHNMSLLRSRTFFDKMSVYEHLAAADLHLSAAMRASKSKLSREDIREAQFKIDDALNHELPCSRSKAISQAGI